MKLVYLGKQLDVTKEHEIISNNPFGFKVTITYTEESWYTNKKEVVHNCTEVHHLFSKDYMGGPSTAFESDLHRSGFIRRISDIESVVIRIETKMRSQHRVNH